MELDAHGRVNGLAPGQAGFAEAALRSTSRQVLLDWTWSAGNWRSFTVNPGARLAFYLIQNGSTAEWLETQQRDPAQVKPLFFSLPEANPDGIAHVRSHDLGHGIWHLQWEDLVGGGDRDFNDLEMNVFRPGLRTPGEEGQGVPMSIAFLERDAQYRNEVGLDWVDGPDGAIAGLRPGDKGDREAAFQPGRQVLLSASGDTPQQLNLTVPAGQSFGWYQVADGSIADLQDGQEGWAEAYFSYAAANPDQLNHVHAIGDSQTWAWEELLGIGDADFNDVVFRFDFGTPSPPRAVLSAPVADGESATVAQGGTSLNLALLRGDTDRPEDAAGAGLSVAEVNGMGLSSLTAQTNGTYAGFYAINGRNGTLYVKTDGTAFYVHNGSKTMGDSFSYRTKDGAGNLSNLATIQLTITPIDDTTSVLAAREPHVSGVP